jgi:2-oxoglutarate ferredoxin oxidoreductase subunit beta
MPTVKEFTTPHKPTWCPGCGNFGMWEALKRALSELGWEKHEFAVVWGIGCHGNGADFLDVQGMHTLHGRTLPPATALRLTRPDLGIIVEMGDGDGYGIGMGHFIHTLRRNPRMTVIVHDNQIYGLTTGQASPTTDHLMPTVSTPGGVLEEPVNPIGLAIAQDATFVARGFAGDIPHLTALYKEALTHPGLALVDVLQPCVTWNHLNTFQWFRERVYKLEPPEWNPADRAAAFELSMTTFRDMHCTPETCRVPIGVYYRREGIATYEDGVPAAQEVGFLRAEQPRDVSEITDSLR